MVIFQLPNLWCHKQEFKFKSFLWSFLVFSFLPSLTDENKLVYMFCGNSASTLVFCEFLFKSFANNLSRLMVPRRIIIFFSSFFSFLVTRFFKTMIFCCSTRRAELFKDFKNNPPIELVLNYFKSKNRASDRSLVDGDGLNATFRDQKRAQWTHLDHRHRNELWNFRARASRLRFRIQPCPSTSSIATAQKMLALFVESARAHGR